MADVNLKLKLQDLIDNSPALSSLPEADREVRKKAMLSADDETMQQFVAVLENESAQMQKLDEDMAVQTEEINSLITEANELEKEAKRELRKQEEKTERSEEKQKAEALLKKLDEVDDK
jgi:hypothetical protein